MLTIQCWFIYCTNQISIYEKNLSKSETYLENSEAVARRCSVKKVFLKISESSLESTCARVSFLIKLWPATLLIKKLWHRCFLVNFAKFFGTLLFLEHLWWLLLKSRWLGYTTVFLWYIPRAMTKGLQLY